MMFTGREEYVRHEQNKEARLRAEAHRQRKLLQPHPRPFRPFGLSLTRVGNWAVRFGHFLGADAGLPPVRDEKVELA